MPEMLKPTSLIMGAGLGQDVACVTDGRFSGGYATLTQPPECVSLTLPIFLCEALTGS